MALAARSEPGRRWADSPSRLLPLRVVAGLAFGVVDPTGRRLAGYCRAGHGDVWAMACIRVHRRATALRRPIATLAGVLSLTAAVAGYYGYMHFGQGAASATYLARQLPIWLLTAVAGGIAFGYLGSIWRLGDGRLKAGAASAPIGVLAGEAIVGLVVYSRWSVVTVYPWELLLAVVLPAVFVRGLRLRMGLVTVTARARRHYWPRRPSIRSRSRST